MNKARNSKGYSEIAVYFATWLNPSTTAKIQKSRDLTTSKAGLAIRLAFANLHNQ